MRRWWKYAVLVCVGLCSLYSVPAYAEDWEVYVPDLVSEAPAPVASAPAYDYDDELEDDWDVELINDLATDSDWQYAQEYVSAAASSASPADAFFVQNDGIMMLSSYNPYDSSISTSVLTYFDNYVQRLVGKHYVFFRSGQYTYRLVYGTDLQCSGTNFSGNGCDYVSYDTRYYTWSSGSEGAFSLAAGSYLVYSDLGNYPLLGSATVAPWLIGFVAVVFLLFTLFRSFFGTHRMQL